MPSPSLETAGIKTGATDFVEKTTGTLTVPTSLGDNSTTRHMKLEGASFQDDTQLEFVTKEAKSQASSPDGYTQRRTTFVIKVPKALANGLYTMDTARFTYSRSVETTAAEVLEMMSLASQCVGDEDFSTFYAQLSVQ